MAIKRSTKIKRLITKREKMIEESTAQLFEELAEVVDGANTFLREIAPEIDFTVVWHDIALLTDPTETVVIKGTIANPQSEMQAASLMILSVPIDLAAEGSAHDITDYLFKESGGGQGRQDAMENRERKQTPPPSDSRREFDLEDLTDEQKKSLEMFRMSRGGKN